jgi:hypothetical protein
VIVVKVLVPEVGSVVCPDIVEPDDVGVCVVSDVSGAVVETPLQANVASEKKSIIINKMDLLIDNFIYTS